MVVHAEFSQIFSEEKKGKCASSAVHGELYLPPESGRLDGAWVIRKKQRGRALRPIKFLPLRGNSEENSGQVAVNASASGSAATAVAVGVVAR